MPERKMLLWREVGISGHGGQVCLVSQSFLFLCVAMLVTGCGPYMWHPSTFQTGNMMKKGETECELHSFVWLPSNVGFAFAPADRLEIRAIVGGMAYVETPSRDTGPVVGAEVNLTKGLFQNRWLFTSGSIGLEKSLFGAQTFSSYRILGCFSVGLYPSTWFGIYIPLKVAWVSARWRSQSRTGFQYVPGIGLSFESSTWFFRVAGSFPRPSDTGAVENTPYLGLQIGVRNFGRHLKTAKSAD